MTNIGISAIGQNSPIGSERIEDSPSNSCMPASSTKPPFKSTFLRMASRERLSMALTYLTLDRTSMSRRSMIALFFRVSDLKRQWKVKSRTSFSSFKEQATSELRSEEHTSELQSRRDLVCRLLLEKKKKKKKFRPIKSIHNYCCYRIMNH